MFNIMELAPTSLASQAVAEEYVGTGSSLVEGGFQGLQGSCLLGFLGGLDHSAFGTECAPKYIAFVILV